MSDVVVIGGGVIGCSVGYALANEGASVTVLDAHTPGRATSASAGGLWAIGESLGLGCGVIFHEGAGAPSPLPDVFMDFLVESSRRFPALAEDLRERTGIDIEAETGTGLLYILYDDADERHANQILEFLGGSDRTVEYWPASRVAEEEPLLTRELRGAVHFPGDNQVNPMLLTEALRRACGGARPVEARVTGFRVESGRVAAVESTAGTFACDAVVNAAGSWSGELMKKLGRDLPIFPVKGQIVCTETLSNSLRFNLSTQDCYLLQKSHGEVLVGSTTEQMGFDTSVDVDSLRGLARGASRAVPSLGDVSVKRTWAGLRPATPDELPILGPDPAYDNLFHATGGFRTGIVAAPLSGTIVAASVLGTASPFPIEPFLASRFEREGREAAIA